MAGSDFDDTARALHSLAEVDVRRWRGLKSLIHDAVDRTTRLVEEGHESVARSALRVASLAPPIVEHARAIDSVRRGATAGVLMSVRAVNRMVQRVTDVGLDAAERVLEPDAREDPLVPMRSDAMGAATWLGDAALGAVNAAVGDHLHAAHNGLSLGMELRYGDRYLPLRAREPAALRDALAGATPRLAVFVHGLATTEWSWCLNAAQYHGDAGTHFGVLLARDLDYTPLFARFNSGRHISENGRLLAAAIERVVAAWPQPLEEIVLVGHSMGGLVVRSACHYGREAGHQWLARVRRVFCLGAPHHGAALEKISNVATAALASIDVPGTRIPALLLRDRSAGIKDLRYGNVVDEDWLGHDPDAVLSDTRREVRLLDDVAYYFVAATITRDANHPLGLLLGDLLVRVPSASGPAVTHGTFRIETQRFGGVMHHELQNHPDVYRLIQRVCAGTADPALG